VLETFGIRLRKAREQKGLTQVELANNLGISQSAVAQWESGRSFPGRAMASRLQKLLGISLPDTADDGGASSRRVLGRRRRLPVVGSPAPGDEERILIDATPRGEVLAPPQLEGVEGAKAVYVRGRAMEPRYYSGEIVYLNPNRPPNPGDFVFLTIKETSFPAGVGYIRQFAGSDLVSVRVYTINPKREELIPLQAVIEIATIVGSGLF
jgi:transcriptional regulator with XRE-family HTH domain